MLSLLFLLVSCSDKNPDAPPAPIKVITAGMITNAMTSAITVTFTCNNSEAVKKDVEMRVKEWFGLPENKEKGIVGTLCATAVQAIIPLVFGSVTNIATKPEWGCTGKNVSDASAKLAGLACSFIPV